MNIIYNYALSYDNAIFINDLYTVSIYLYTNIIIF